MTDETAIDPTSLVPFVPPREASDGTIRVLEIPRVRAFSYAFTDPRSEHGAATRLVSFGEGPWLYEPDHVKWSARGIDRVLVRGPMGTWAGVLILPETHPLYAAEFRVDASMVHGGLTLDRKAWERPPQGDHYVGRILGWDCCHAGDLQPAWAAYFRLAGLGSVLQSGVYRDVWFAAAETMRLANALDAMTNVALREATG